MTANPTLLAMPLAQNGQKNVIPETQATPGNGLFSQSTGFPSETSLPLGAGGVAPSREDFNGLANLLGGVAFYAQKGFTFNYDATQDYYAGCIVIDPSDGLRYECIADMTAGTIAPHDDSTNTYWTIFKSGLDREQIPAFNHRDVITTSGTYTAPVTGWYRIEVKGGGGGGGGGSHSSTSGYDYSGGGGGEGGITIGFEHLTAGDSVPVVIGGGGAGGANSTAGAAGGTTTVTINGNTYSASGGNGGSASGRGGKGGTGTIQGCAGGSAGAFYQSVGQSLSGGGRGGVPDSNSLAVQGGGGAGKAFASTTGSYQNGGDGFVAFEYFASIA